MGQLGAEREICTKQINENLKLIEQGKPLNLPLRRLNTNCEFKIRYEQWCNVQDGLPENYDVKKIRAREYRQRPEIKAKLKKYQKEYQQRFEVKAKMKEYQQRPEIKVRYKEYHKQYRNKPEAKAKLKEHQQKPEVIAKRREHDRRPEIKARRKEQRDRPEAKAKLREYYQRRKKQNVHSNR